jgi:hypothetical protein
MSPRMDPLSKTAAEYTALLALVLVTPPTIEVREQDFDGDFEMFGNEYLVIDGGSFEAIPILGSRPSIVGPVEVVEWMLHITTDNRTSNDHLASPDVLGVTHDTIAEVFNHLTMLWLSDQLSGHAQAIGEAAEAAALAGH